MNFETHDDRNQAGRNLKSEYRNHLITEIGEKLAIIENSETLEETGTAYHDAIQKLGEVDQIETFLKSWQPPPPVNLPVISATPPPPPDWLLRHWLPRAELTILSGTGGLGKSHLALQLCSALASGCPESYLDPQFKPSDSWEPAPEKSMIATWEDNHASTQRRIYRIASTMSSWFDTTAVQENVIFRDMKAQGPMWIPATESGHIANRGHMGNAGHELLKSCEDEEIRFLVLDSIVAIFGQDINSATHVRSFLNYLGAWCNDTGITALMIGHPSKADKQGKQGALGSVDWTNGVRASLTLSEEEADEDDEELTKGKKFYQLNHFKVNDAPAQPSKPLERKKNGIWIESGSRKQAISAYEQYDQQWKETGKNEFPIND